MGRTGCYALTLVRLVILAVQCCCLEQGTSLRPSRNMQHAATCCNNVVTRVVLGLAESFWVLLLLKLFWESWVAAGKSRDRFLDFAANHCSVRPFPNPHAKVLAPVTSSFLSWLESVPKVPSILFWDVCTAIAIPEALDAILAFEFMFWHCFSICLHKNLSSNHVVSWRALIGSNWPTQSRLNTLLQKCKWPTVASTRTLKLGSTQHGSILALHISSHLNRLHAQLCQLNRSKCCIHL